VAGRLAACIRDLRDPDRIVQGLDEIIRFRLLMIAAGYEDGNDANRLRTDPMFKLAMARLGNEAALGSQPTMSRLENLPDTRALLRMGRAMVDLYCASFRQVPRRIVLDVDDTFDAVHGEQQMRLFNVHYDGYGFQPIVVFDGEGHFVTAVLRPGSCSQIGRMGAVTPAPVAFRRCGRRFGRPSSSMRLRAWTATFTSVARRSSVRERSPSPITCLNLPMAASTRARFVYPETFCQAARPCSAMLCRCGPAVWVRSRPFRSARPWTGAAR